jgi:hypothetical protein
MQNNALFFIGLRIIFGTLFLITLFVGAYGAKNYQRFFGVDAAMPTDTRSARNYTKLLVIGIWAHAVAITGGFALMF